jgi:ubiquinone/menaquinone biosynthesis C-methylase UbiE
MFAGDTAGSRYYEFYSHLSFLENFNGGKFILDAASGPIAHPEYLAYSSRFKYRVCADISITALKEARRKLGRRGIYCLCDVASLPFADEIFASIISGYTIQHIDKDRQISAVSELVRVLSQTGVLSIITDIEPALRRAARLTKRLAKRLLFSRIGLPPGSEHRLYFYPRSVRWWKWAIGTQNATVQISCLRLLRRQGFDRFMGHRISDAKKLRAIETLFPKFLLYFAVYALVEVRK